MNNEEEPKTIEELFVSEYYKLKHRTNKRVSIVNEAENGLRQDLLGGCLQTHKAGS